MKIFVISLPSSIERRHSVIKQLKDLNLDFEFLDAIDGRYSDHPLLDRYIERKFLIHYGRPARPGELGCYASHYLAWERCKKLNEPILVLEDDFQVTDLFRDAYETSQEIIDRYGYIRLQDTRKSKAVFVRQEDDFRIVRYTKAPQGALCYALTPFAARQFIEHSQNFVYPVDVFIRHFYIHRVPLYGLTPYSIDGGELSKESVIGKRVKVKKDFLTIFQRFLFKGYVMLRTGVENIKNQYLIRI